jgi:hypothetical protein
MSGIQLNIWNECSFALEEGVSTYATGFTGRSVDELACRFATEWTKEQFARLEGVIGQGINPGDA